MKKIAIVGRPNVGKSALFNRFAGRQISIVHDQPGVTRDRLSVIWKMDGSTFELFDTGGIGSEPDPDFSKQTALAAETAIDEADLLLFIVDGLCGRTPLDEALAARLRTKGKPVLLVVNKIDERVHDGLPSDFAKLGFRNSVAVSAAHGRDMEDLYNKIFELSGIPLDAEPELEDPEEQEVLPERPARVVLLGRPNVGKSSLANAILGDERTIVNAQAGTTRDAVDIPYEFADRKYVLCDTAGMRHRSKHNTSVEVFSVMRSEKALRGADLCLLVIDVTAGVTSQDQKIAQQIQEAGRAVLIVLNKWDLIAPEGTAKETMEHHISRIRGELFFLSYAMVVALSAKSGTNITRLFLAVEKMRQHATRRIGTGELNRHLKASQEAYPPPMRSGRRLKILYATQVEPNRPGPFAPPEVVLFVNEPKLLVPAYKEFLTRRIRDKWEFPGLPIRFRMRGRKEPES